MRRVLRSHSQQWQRAFSMASELQRRFLPKLETLLPRFGDGACDCRVLHEARGKLGDSIQRFNPKGTKEMKCLY